MCLFCGRDRRRGPVKWIFGPWLNWGLVFLADALLLAHLGLYRHTQGDGEVRVLYTRTIHPKKQRHSLLPKKGLWRDRQSRHLNDGIRCPQLSRPWENLYNRSMLDQRRIADEGLLLRGHLKNESQHKTHIPLGNPKRLARCLGLLLNQQRTELRVDGYIHQPYMRSSGLCSQDRPYEASVLGRPVTLFAPSFQRPSFLRVSMRSKRLRTLLFLTFLFDFPKLGWRDMVV